VRYRQVTYIQNKIRKAHTFWRKHSDFLFSEYVSYKSSSLVEIGGFHVREQEPKALYNKYWKGWLCASPLNVVY